MKNYKLEQARNGKIAIYGGLRPTMLSLTQVNDLGVDVYGLTCFDHELYLKSYHMEDIANAGLPVAYLKRREFFSRLLEEQQAKLRTPERDQSIRLLKELIDELPRDWMGYEYRQAQKFIGTINAVAGDAREIEFETESGVRWLRVDNNPDLREFIRTGYDEGRHRRYDKDINTQLVASVKDITLVDLDWLVPWDENAPESWELIEPKTMRCCCTVHEEEHIFEFVQANPCPDDEHHYRYTEAFISLKRYSPEQINNALHSNGYRGMADFRGCGGKWKHLAGLLFDREAAAPENEMQQNLTFDEVKQKIEKWTGLDLSDQLEA